MELINGGFKRQEIRSWYYIKLRAGFWHWHWDINKVSWYNRSRKSIDSRLFFLCNIKAMMDELWSYFSRRSEFQEQYGKRESFRCDVFGLDRGVSSSYGWLTKRLFCDVVIDCKYLVSTVEAIIIGILFSSGLITVISQLGVYFTLKGWLNLYPFL